MKGPQLSYKRTEAPKVRRILNKALICDDRERHRIAISPGESVRKGCDIDRDLARGRGLLIERVHGFYGLSIGRGGDVAPAVVRDLIGRFQGRAGLELAPVRRGYRDFVATGIVRSFLNRCDVRIRGACRDV